jgi:hypothetical protein
MKKSAGRSSTALLSEDAEKQTMSWPGWRPLLATFSMLSAIFLASPNVLPRGDPALSVPTARSLIYDRDLDLEEYESVDAVSGHYGFIELGDRSVDFFPWLNSLAAVPVVGAVDIVSTFGLTPDTDELIRDDRGWVVQYVAAALWSAGSAIVLALIAMRLNQFVGLAPGIDGRRLPEVVHRWPLQSAAILIGLSTPLWSITSRSLSAHGPAMFCVAVGILLSLRRPLTFRTSFLAGNLCAVAFWIRPVTLVASLTVLAIVWVSSRKSVAPYLCGLIAVHVAVLTANLMLLGRWLPPYFDGGRLGLHSEYAVAVSANLVSPARGLVLFCPQILVLLALLVPSVRGMIGYRARTVVYIMLSSAGVVLALVSGFGFQWWAGHTYGPRFMTDALAFLVPVALVVSVALYTRQNGGRLGRWVVIGVWALASVVHWQGAWFHSTQCWNGQSELDVDIAPERVWSISDAQLTSGVRSLINDGAPTAMWRACESNDQ